MLYGKVTWSAMLGVGCLGVRLLQAGLSLRLSGNERRKTRNSDLCTLGRNSACGLVLLDGAEAVTRCHGHDREAPRMRRRCAVETCSAPFRMP